MNLSPCANYEIRRMLKEHVDSVSVIQARALRVSESMNLNNLLMALYPRKFEMVSRIRNLEMLTDLYRQVSGNRSSRQLAQVELRGRIFQILGIRFGVSEVLMSSIVPEMAVTALPFFAGGLVREAMLYRQKFYGKIDQAKTGSCSQLYQLALVLVEKGFPCLITTSPEVYCLWVGVRSPVYGVFLRDGVGVLRLALRLHSILCRFKQAKFAVY
jgi:hypothetical protein